MKTEEILKNGYVKNQKILVTIPDRNNKKHFYLFDTMEEAKKFTDNSVQKQFITYFTKIK